MDLNLDTGVETQPEVEPTIIETSPDEVTAKQSGWTPKEEYKGDPAKWVDAAEFNRRGELFDKISVQGRQVKALEASLNALRSHYDKVAEREYANALADIKAQRTAAIRDGDVALALELGDAIDERKEQLLLARNQRQAELTVPSDIAPVFETWIAENAWYEQDSALRSQADILGAGYKATNPNKTPAEVLAFVVKEIKSTNPNKFGGAKVATVSGGTVSRGITGQSKNVTLSPEETKIMNQLVRDGVLTKEQYLADLAKIKSRS